MGISTTEMWNRERVVREELQRSGVVDKLEKRVKSRIQRVVDSAAGRRTFRNLWGLRPVRQQELFHWDDGEGLFMSSTRVGGKRLSISSELGELGEDLVGGVMEAFGEMNPVSDIEEGHDKLEIKTTEIYKSAAGVEFHRLAYRVNRIQEIDDPEEFVPGFPATLDIVWFAVFPK